MKRNVLHWGNIDRRMLTGNFEIDTLLTELDSKMFGMPRARNEAVFELRDHLVSLHEEMSLQGVDPKRIREKLQEVTRGCGLDQRQRKVFWREMAGFALLFPLGIGFSLLLSREVLHLPLGLGTLGLLACVFCGLLRKSPFSSVETNTFIVSSITVPGFKWLEYVMFAYCVSMIPYLAFYRPFPKGWENFLYFFFFAFMAVLMSKLRFRIEVDEKGFELRKFFMTTRVEWSQLTDVSPLGKNFTLLRHIPIVSMVPYVSYRNSNGQTVSFFVPRSLRNSVRFLSLTQQKLRETQGSLQRTA